MTDSRRGLIIISKSRWEPSIRREHALARLALEDGYRVTFIEAPIDIREIRRSPKRWLDGFLGKPLSGTPKGIRVVQRSCVVPPLRNFVAEMAERVHLRSVLVRELRLNPGVIVMTLPWHFASIPPGPRVILDVADDWVALVPARAARIRSLYQAAARLADEIVVVSEALEALFSERRVHVVRNGVEPDFLNAETGVSPVPGRLVYLGTLSERFDAELLGELMSQLPSCTADLYGPCAYAGYGSDPGPELAALITQPGQRAEWHGPVRRGDAASVLDAGDVLLVLNRGDRSRGQDSMKIYDYAARGRPILATSAAIQGISEVPPHTYVGSTAEHLARLIEEAQGEPESLRAERRKWAATQTWGARWPSWQTVIFGPRQATGRGPNQTDGSQLGGRPESRYGLD